MFTHLDTEIIVGPVAPRTGKWHELAEAARRGFAIKPLQCFGSLFGESHEAGTACFRGAAYMGGMDLERPEANPSFECPEGCGFPVGIVHLNDDHRWTRERIADWLDTL